MESQNLVQVFQFFLDFTILLVPRLCVVVVAAFACIRLPWVRRAVRDLEASWKPRLMLALAFGGLGILATHSGILVNVDKAVGIIEWPVNARLNDHQAVVSFRDTLVMAGGLIGGPWVGFGAGLIAGAERYWLGGFVNGASGLSTLCLGVLAGWARYRRPHGATTPKGAFIIALFGTVVHRLFLIYFATPTPLATLLSLDIALPVAVVNCLGCVSFIWVIRDLDRDKLESELREAQCREQEAHLLKQQAELCVLRAQVEPHFLNNTLNAIRSLIRIDPDRAREYVVKLADFFETTRRFAGANAIPLHEEMEQLGRYLDFQQLRFGERFVYLPADIPDELLDCCLPPHCLLTLAENALAHGMKDCASGFVIRVDAEDMGISLRLRVSDNGCGIAPERLAKLGKEPVDSPFSNGIALYQLASSLNLAFLGEASLTLASELGNGTEVVLTLPKIRSENQ